ncbi:MAG TPA: zf-TFIIB domain-containing protein [Verrucomicrobiae bacterium]|nr:zf-TFIIB domain-containing protein [Verrucomicrobiae bacterium]
MQIQLHRQHAERRLTTPRKCPVCTATELVPAQRRGIEIDYCPKCRGVWLDRGELETLIEQAGNGAPEIHIRCGPIAGDKNGGPQVVPTFNHRYLGQPERKRSWLREIFG